MDHVGVIVDDLDAAIAFFVALGLEAGGPMTVEGEAVDRVIALDGARSRIAFVTTPDGHHRLELCEFQAPVHHGGDHDRTAPANAPGLRHLCFAVDDLDAALERLRPHGAQLVGEVVDYEGVYKLCYLRGPAGIIVELAERLGG
jgi:catechol 2,3-dioxygenase-like lactoylglutathione lyase family enzyme